MVEWQESLINEAPERELAQKILYAIQLLLDNDAALLVRDVNERTISGRLSDYLRPQFPGWDIDCEYNRDDHMVKKIDGHVVVPDIIVHHRGTSDNLLVIEVKKSNTREPDEGDLEKLYTFRNSHLRYQHALFVKLLVGEGAPGVTRFQWV